MPASYLQLSLALPSPSTIFAELSLASLERAPSSSLHIIMCLKDLYQSFGNQLLAAGVGCSFFPSSPPAGAAPCASCSFRFSSSCFSNSESRFSVSESPPASPPAPPVAPASAIFAVAEVEGARPFQGIEPKAGVPIEKALPERLRSSLV